MERGKPVLFLDFLGKWFARWSDNNAGIGGWKKLMPDCNDLDTDRCLIAKASPLPTGAL